MPLDPGTLRPLSRGEAVGRMLGPVAWSPDRKRVALAVRPSGRVQVVGGPTVATATRTGWLQWAGRRVFSVGGDGAIAIVDPDAGRVVARAQVNGRVEDAQAAGSRLVVLLEGRLAIISARGTAWVVSRCRASCTAVSRPRRAAPTWPTRPGCSKSRWRAAPSRGGCSPRGRRRTTGPGAPRSCSTLTRWRSRAVTRWPPITAAARARTGCGSWTRADGRRACSIAAPRPSVAPAARWCSTRARMARDAGSDCARTRPTASLRVDALVRPRRPRAGRRRLRLRAHHRQAAQCDARDRPALRRDADAPGARAVPPLVERPLAKHQGGGRNAPRSETN